MKDDMSFSIWLVVWFIYICQMSQCSDMHDMKRSLQQIEVNTRAKQ